MHGSLAISTHDRPTFYLGDPIGAELLDAAPRWHVLITAPNAERIAAGHLVARRFGVYLPEFARTFPMRRGRPAYTRSLPLFPGYLFAFVWDVAAHSNRIRACPGVVDLLRATDGNPVIIADELIARIQLVEFAQLGLGGKTKRRRWRKERAEDDEPASVPIVIRSYSAMDNSLPELDDAARNSILHKALGL